MDGEQGVRCPVSVALFALEKISDPVLIFEEDSILFINSAFERVVNIPRQRIVSLRTK
jgi:hypothetical protein